MGTSLFGLTPAATYPALIKFGDNSAISGTLRALSDGLGTDLPIQVSTAGVNFTGTASIGGTALSPSSGVAGAIQFSNGSAFASDAANLFWDDTNNRLGVGTNAPDTTAHFKGGVAGSVGVRVATFEGNLPEILFKDTNNNTGFAIAKYGQIVYFVNTNASGGYSSYSGLTNSNGQWSFGGGFNPSAQVHIKGSGSTSATTSLLVQNSAGTELLKVRDDNKIFFGGSASHYIDNGYNFVGSYYWINEQIVRAGIVNDSGSVKIIDDLNVGGNTNNNNSAILQADSTTQGFLPPRMTTTQKNAIASPAAGLVVYDSTTNKLNYNNGTTWKEITPDGYTGLVTINAMPPVTFDIQNGIIVNVI